MKSKTKSNEFALDLKRKKLREPKLVLENITLVFIVAKYWYIIFLMMSIRLFLRFSCALCSRKKHGAVVWKNLIQFSTSLALGIYGEIRNNLTENLRHLYIFYGRLQRNRFISYKWFLLFFISPRKTSLIYCKTLMRIIHFIISVLLK